MKAQQVRAGFWGIDLALTVAAVFFVVKAVQFLLIHPEAAPEPLTDPSPARFTASYSKIRPYKEYEPLGKSNLFGALSSSNVAARKVVEEKLPETTLDLELLGCVVGGDPTTSFAIIRDKKGRAEDTYSVGDFIVSDARVEDIRTTEVVISHAGRREVLAMLFDDSKSASPPRRGQDGARRPSRRTQARSPSASNEPIRVINDRLRQVNRERLMEEVTSNLGSLMSQVQTSPNVVDDKPSGINVESMGSDPILGQSGLKPGDIVKSVNGLRVNSLEDVLGSADRFQNAPEIRVVVERDGRHTTLVYKIR